MNPQRGDKGIGWTDATWNPITGCEHGCGYCYARKMYQRFGRSFEPTFYPDRLDEPLKRKVPLKIFVGSVTDVGGTFIEREWIEAVLDVVTRAHWHTFQFLTKRPRGLFGYSFPENAIIGTTITQEAGANQAISALTDLDARKFFVSFEPLLGDVRDVSLNFVDWAIIGPQTGADKVEPRREWVDSLLYRADQHAVKVFMKKALKPYIDAWGVDWRREFPQ